MSLSEGFVISFISTDAAKRPVVRRMDWKDKGIHYTTIEGDVDFSHGARIIKGRVAAYRSDGILPEYGLAGQVGFQAHLNQNGIYYQSDLPEFIWKIHTPRYDFRVLGVGWIDIKTFRYSDGVLHG